MGQIYKIHTFKIHYEAGRNLWCYVIDALSRRECAMKNLTEEMVGEFVRLRRQGQSFRAIARQFKVDARTVKARVDKASQHDKREHWEAIAQQLDARYLNEHYQLLLGVAGRVLNAVSTEPMFAQTDTDAHKLLKAITEAALDDSLDLMSARGVDLESRGSTSNRDGISRSAKPRLSGKLFESLLEHEPDIESAIAEWKRRWATFQKQRSGLSEQAIGLFGEFKGTRIAGEVAAALAPTVSKFVIMHRLHSHGQPELEIEEGEGQTISLVVKNTLTNKPVYKGLGDQIKGLHEAFRHVCEQLAHEERLRPLEDSYRDLTGSVSEIEGLVDAVVLVGRPGGHCRLCPGSDVASQR